MEPEASISVQEPQSFHPKSVLHEVTPLSKYLAMSLFVILPFVGGYIGYTLAPEKVVEVERVVTKEVKVMADSVSDDSLATPTIIDMGAYRIQYNQNAVELINDKSEVLQTIEASFSQFTNLTNQDAFVIVNRDINYDHYLDVGILQAVGQGATHFYGFYVYDPIENQLVREDTLGAEYEAEGKTIANPNFDIENKTASTCTMGPVALKEYRCQTFTFDGEGYVAGETWTESWGGEDFSE